LLQKNVLDFFPRKIIESFLDGNAFQCEQKKVYFCRCQKSEQNRSEQTIAIAIGVKFLS
jgi:hypothetical protein